jgi:rSAM/selenodomain-associated transferase 2
MKISVIIPTLNEATRLGRLLTHLQTHGAEQILEILVVDGGSTDETCHIAQEHGAQVLRCAKPSRAAQMNCGARAAQGELLYFVHADTLPPKSFVGDIAQAIRQGYRMGCFRYRFDSDRYLLRCNAWFTRFNFLWCQGGDKTFFIFADTFAELGSYDERYVFMEEYEFLIRARKQFATPTLPQTATVSARKYENNSWLRVQLANLLVFNLFRFGVEPSKLRAVYKKFLNPYSD